MALKINKISDHGEITLPDPPITHLLFSTTKLAWLFTIIRIYVGWQWVQASWHKVTDPAWVQTGAALKGFWMGAVAVPDTGKAAITYDWYRSFLQFLLDANAYTWFAKLIAYGELLVGIGLIVGALVGIAAFFGALMNFSFMLAGSASTNPVLFLLAVVLMLAWKVAGYYGLDYYLLPMLGTPWGKNRAPTPKPTAMRA
ncbi:DoxX family membrane protein [Chloroflexales bacterium ZM16-3]|nr:DoxX family membrane protein [Chloroflexales bacterium ZM16-3]